MGRSNGPLVIFFTLVAFIVTVIFKADVDAQAGAYATGVLVLMTSAALAVSLNQFRLRKQSAWTYSLITVVFVYSVSDASEFIGDCLEVRGVEINGFKILRCNSPAIPNAIAAILMHLRAETNTIPHAYFGWTEGNPLAYVFKYIFFGEGETAPVTREILRELERDPERRPRIHVG